MQTSAPTGQDHYTIISLSLSLLIFFGFFYNIRYKIYAEGWAWSVSEKYILACNSPTLLIPSRWHDFFTRGLIPRRHFWPLRDSQKCSSIEFAVEWGNTHTAEVRSYIMEYALSSHSTILWFLFFRPRRLGKLGAASHARL